MTQLALSATLSAAAFSGSVLAGGYSSLSTLSGSHGDWNPSSKSDTKAGIRTEFMEPKKLAELLRPGDLIESFDKDVDIAGISTGIKYRHWAVYLGKCEDLDLQEDHPLKAHPSKHIVVQLVNRTKEESDDKEESVDPPSQESKPNIMAALLEEYSAGQMVRQNNIQDEEIGEEWKYDVLKCNCEHFALYCRYGYKLSHQANHAQKKSKLVRLFGLIEIN